MSDLIEREDAIEVAYQLRRKPNDEEWNWWLRSFNAIPSADRPQGEWIRDRYWSRGIGMGEEYGFFYKCSLCEYEVENGYTRCGFNFCPYCGADMRSKIVGKHADFMMIDEACAKGVDDE